ncbi:MAG: DUF3800 domain-containing protein, partial [bacterium]|nr:DUF3800 domain-containing protein [bacterium]
MPTKIIQKLYCYVDETGQDDSSEVFIVVAVVSDKEQGAIRQSLLEIECLAKTGQRKWHKSKPERRINYLRLLLEKRICQKEVFFASYKKPLPYFLPLLETIEGAINEKAKGKYKVIVYIDGMDKKKSREMANALRLRKISLDFVKGKRDESEPLIRLADMWAGCLRAVFLYKERLEEKKLIEKAERNFCLINLNKKPS